MIPLEDARARVLGSLPTPESITITSGSALGLVLAADVVSPSVVPPFANSAMDGFAVRHEDLTEIPIVLSVTEDLAAGHVARGQVERGTAIKIMTGAPIPIGADTVVKVEDTEPAEGAVKIMQRPEPGTAVRPAGGDVGRGDLVFGTGEVLTARHLGVLAAIGVPEVEVYRPLRAAILSTGDEVMPPDTVELEPGQIRDSNRPLLDGLLSSVGAEVVDFGIVRDDPDALRQAFTTAASECDIVVTSGGVSMGEYDLVKQVLVELGDVELWKVAMQPAKPFAFGRVGDAPLFGLPGNPVSVFVAFEQFVRPAIRQMTGHSHLLRPRLTGTLSESVDTDPEKTVFLRVVVDLDADGRPAKLAGGQSSNVLSATARADGFAVVPRGVGSVGAGETVQLEMFGWSHD